MLLVGNQRIKTITKIFIFSVFLTLVVNGVMILLLDQLSYVALGLLIVFSVLMIAVSLAMLVGRKSREKKGYAIYWVMLLSGIYNLIFWLGWLREVGGAF